MYDVILDAGHGGYDPGAIGPTGLKEKDVNLKVVLKVGLLLVAQGLTVAYTRTTDIFVSLEERASLANNKLKARNFLSIHGNSAANVTAAGTETYVLASGGDREKMARSIQAALVAATGLANRGVKAANFKVLRETAMPAALVETAFICNAKEEALLKSDAFLDKVALAIAKGFCSYLGRAWKEDKPTVAPPKEPAANNTELEQEVKRLSAALKSQEAETEGYRLSCQALNKEIKDLKGQMAADNVAGLKTKISQLENVVEKANALKTVLKEFIGG